MDCLQAQTILSEAIDGAVDSDALSEARAHCEGCPECATFIRGLDLLSRAAVPGAPPALVDSLIARGAEEAAAIREATTAAEHDASAETAPVDTPIVRFVPTKWTPRLTAFASVAAVLLVALVATGIGLGGLLGGQRAATETAGTSVQEYGTTTSAPLGATPPSADASNAAKDMLSAIAAPPYIVVEGVAYAPTGSRAVQASLLVTAPPVYTALDSGADPVSIPAFRITGENGTVVLQQSDGTYLGFTTIIRRFGGRRFVLTSGTSVTAYGAWPTLPARFVMPTDADGSPTFSFFGKDDAGVLIYVPPGGAPASGFAVAPGTDPSDPAAGNPNWTWWQPE